MKVLVKRCLWIVEKHNYTYFNIYIYIYFKTRWQNHKSHIRKAVRSCEIACHFNDKEFHTLTKDPLKTFYNELSDQVEVIIFEKLDFSKCINQDDRMRTAKERESFWQNQLMTLNEFGGLNKRSAYNEIKNWLNFSFYSLMHLMFDVLNFFCFDNAISFQVPHSHHCKLNLFCHVTTTFHWIDVLIKLSFRLMRHVKIPKSMA